jgi:hypothetical protein
VKKNFFLIRYTAAAVLLIVAVTQFYLVKTLHISPWKGGGFGMFSTVGSQSSYFIRVFYNSSPGEKISISIPEKFISEEQAIFYFPVKNNFLKLKDDLLKEKWFINNDKNKIMMNDMIDSCCNNQYSTVKIINIRIELWQYKFDINSSKLYSTLLAKY